MVIKNGTYSVSDFYTGDNCPNCGRNRILTIRVQDNKIKRICEKCSWCIEDSEYTEIEDEYGCTSDLFG